MNPPEDQVWCLFPFTRAAHFVYLCLTHSHKVAHLLALFPLFPRQPLYPGPESLFNKSTGKQQSSSRGPLFADSSYPNRGARTQEECVSIIDMLSSSFSSVRQRLCYIHWTDGRRLAMWKHYLNADQIAPGICRLIDSRSVEVSQRFRVQSCS